MNIYINYKIYIKNGENSSLYGMLFLGGGYMFSSLAGIGQASATRIVEMLLQQAIEVHASDIHIEPLDEAVRVRFRRDGVLLTAASIPLAKADMVTARIKVLARMDIADKRRPQDGRIVWDSHEKTVDLRVSTMPTVRGEKTVLRLLDTTHVELKLETLGITPSVCQSIRQIVSQNRGLFLFSGPTGSGKTSTLYAVLRELHKTEVSIATLEDPVEYKVNGICQSQIHEKGGLVFQNGLRALLRQDPDILVIGEIRDGETANIAVRAALTGHLVLSTVHTASAAEVPERLIDMGVEPYLVADALSGITSQRLARRICRHCRGKEELRKTCTACFSTGYEGRICLCEIMPVKQQLRKCIRQGDGMDEMEAAAITDGAVLMKEVLLYHIQKGYTDWQEIQRVYDNREVSYGYRRVNRNRHC